MSDFTGVPVTIITDCADENARMRQRGRATTLFPGAGVEFVDVGRKPHHTGSYDPTLAAAGSVLDALDAADCRQAVVMVNVAPRHGQAKREHWPNGTPFGYARVGKDGSIVAGTIQGYTFSLLKQLAGVEEVRVFDIKEVLPHLRLPEWHMGEKIANSQFRSFDFLPRATAALANDAVLPSHPWTEIPEIPTRTIWWVDGFGNCKTTILPRQMNFVEGAIRSVGGFTAVCHRRLADLAEGETGFTIGSSGYKDQRFVEIAVCGGSAAERYGLGVGSRLE